MMGIATRGLSLAHGIFRQIDDVLLPVSVCVCVCASGMGWWAITKSDSSLMCHPWECVQAGRVKVNGCLRICAISVGCEMAL